ncbi:hypothetical protein NDU88_003657 [Pleurodeles waltl]|uniref:Uncharacterized protein n=1 Tax=Pleurodeles waltl TaxID=8319 RepID=A0AAV7QCB7_PLEWA|nr:hypothetical protein NDU88_003657 [Pleurodeles waltl]
MYLHVRPLLWWFPRGGVAEWVLHPHVTAFRRERQPSMAFPGPAQGTAVESQDGGQQGQVQRRTPERPPVLKAGKKRSAVRTGGISVVVEAKVGATQDRLYKGVCVADVGVGPEQGEWGLECTGSKQDKVASLETFRSGDKMEPEYPMPLRSTVRQ